MLKEFPNLDEIALDNNEIQRLMDKARDDERERIYKILEEQIRLKRLLKK